MEMPLDRVVVPRPTTPPCPAAWLIAEASGGTGCMCRITHDLLDSARNGTALAVYCFNEDGYQQCPTWRADRDEYWASKTIRDLLDRSGDRVGGHPEDRERNDGLALALDAQERDAWERQQERES